MKNLYVKVSLVVETPPDESSHGGQASVAEVFVRLGSWTPHGLTDAVDKAEAQLRDGLIHTKLCELTR